LHKEGEYWQMSRGESSAKTANDVSSTNKDEIMEEEEDQAQQNDLVDECEMVGFYQIFILLYYFSRTHLISQSKKKRICPNQRNYRQINRLNLRMRQSQFRKRKKMRQPSKKRN
jgi:hypothetical protein